MCMLHTERVHAEHAFAILFQRFRRRHRNPYSAFMERVEREVQSKWVREKQQFESAVERTTNQQSVPKQQKA